MSTETTRIEDTRPPQQILNEDFPNLPPEILESLQIIFAINEEIHREATKVRSGNLTEGGDAQGIMYARTTNATLANQIARFELEGRTSNIQMINTPGESPVIKLTTKTKKLVIKRLGADVDIETITITPDSSKIDHKHMKYSAFGLIKQQTDITPEEGKTLKDHLKQFHANLIKAATKNSVKLNTRLHTLPATA